MKLKSKPILQETKLRLQEVSPSFCLAKWLQTIIYLNRGTTHSCTLCPSHNISVPAIKNNPSALHNTPIKMMNREDMRAGKYPKECDYCWTVEKLGDGEYISDRILKSSGDFARSRFDEVVASGLGETITPSYVEVSFDSVCNLKCLYCTPWASTVWQDEVEKFGPYKLAGKEQHHPVKLIPEETNPFIKAFWEWWPDLFPNLEVLRVTGGEPLKSKHLWKMLDQMKELANPKLLFGVNSNFSLTERIIDKFIEEVNLIEPQLKNFVLYASAEAYGSHQEYIRAGMDFTLFKSNIERFLQNTGSKSSLFFSTTVNLLCYNSFEDFVEWYADLKVRFPGRVNILFIFIRGPEYFDLRLLPETCKKIMSDGIIRQIEKHKDIFTELEVEQLKRLIDVMNKDMEKKDFFIAQLQDFIEQSDQRKGTNYLSLFPELEPIIAKTCLQQGEVGL